MLLNSILIGLLTGTLIGTVGVGGILLTPLLTFFVGTELHIAQATSSFSFLFTGVMGTFIYARQKSIPWSPVAWISVGIIPATVFGAKINTLLPSQVLVLILAALIIFSGFNAFSKTNSNSRRNKKMNKIALVAIGAGVGFGSSLTGTGGPVLLVPTLLLFGFPALAAVGISQVIQLPVAVFATLGFLMFGQIDFSLGLTLGIVQAFGVVVGGKIAHTLPRDKLRLVVALTLVGVGSLMIGRLIF